MRIAIVGSGGVGGYFGARLAAAGSDVAFIARGAHLNALRTNGLRLESPKGVLHLHRVNATDDPSTIGPDTVVVSLQNGVDSVEMLTRAVGRPHVAGGVAYVAAVISEPGTIRHTAMDHLIFGELDGAKTPRLQALLDACLDAGFQATLSERIEADIWSKFVRLSVFSGMTSVTRSPVGPLRDDPDLLAMVQAAILEGMAVAHARGVSLAPRVFDEIMTMLQGLPSQAKSSMLEDLERGKPLELPWLSGAVVRIGRDLDAPTPIHRFIATVLKPHVNGVHQ
jgi:2-dehydropantoate 2-reductase